MEENEKNVIPEANMQPLDLENEFQELPEETSEENIFEEMADLPEDLFRQEAQENAEPMPEMDTSVYRGKGAGRKESPFADSPYVMAREPRREVPVQSAYQKPVPLRKKRTSGGWGKRILAVVGILLLVVGSCGATAYLVNDHWEQRFNSLQTDFRIQVNALQTKVDQLTPQSTGISVSGSAGVGDGLTAGQVYARNVRSVVLIESTVMTSAYGQQTTGVSSGSGFVLSEDGYVLTNYHVIEGATSVTVVLHEGLRHPAQVVGYDSTNDIAVLKVEAKDLVPVEVGSSSDLIVGDQVVAIGNPLGELTSTLTVGYVSAKERTVSTDGTIINMIQTDAAINSGNSGGPLFNMKGQVVGITTAKYSGSSSSGATIEGIGFAIPMDDVMAAVEELIQYGYIKTAYLGVQVQTLDASTASVYGLPAGVYVAGVEEGYCAQRSGIRAGDIIVGLGNVKIETIADLTRALRSYQPGDVAEIKIFRSGITKSIHVKLDERPRDVTAQTQPESQPEGEMPEGNYDEWFEFFKPFFGKGD